MKKRYLTKSRFKLATECPAKLYYTGKKEYANSKLEDSFLASLADGGFQVGELAKCYFPGGHNVSTLDYGQALEETNTLLQQDKVVIFEAAIAYENFFIRADVLEKDHDRLTLYEVKAKSFDPSKEDPFFGKKGNLNSKWKPYLEDVAFQKHVISLAFPQYTIKAFLMMTDKTALSPTEGLNQKFRITKDSSGRKGVTISESLSDEDISIPILCKVPVDSECSYIYKTDYGTPESPKSYSGEINCYAENYAMDKKIETPISKECGKCEFRTSKDEALKGLKSGYKECWKKQLYWTEDDFQDLTIFDVWNFRKKEKMIEEGRLKISDLTFDDIKPKEDGKPGISPSERQWLQIEKYQSKDETIWLDKENLRAEMESWTYPLHFIDFETTMTAIPINKGRRPYEGLAFQFSHHIVDENGNVEHRGEYLNIERGIFPSYHFLRALNEQLETDEGTIFRYSNHENSFLNTIFQQLRTDPAPPPDIEELCDFIKSISHSGNNSLEKWTGDRDMVDLWDLVKRYYYDPATEGSNSIKQVLPAILNSSIYLQVKYSKPIYGAVTTTEGAIRSLNFKDWTWLKMKEGKAIDPYKQLPPMFQDLNEKENTLLSEETDLNNGGAALTAYARMQFEEMSNYEREEIRKALLKYCELDTLAMVMIYEGWKDEI